MTGDHEVHPLPFPPRRRHRRSLTVTRARFAAFLRLPHQRRCRPPKPQPRTTLHWVPSIADPAAPTLAELNAGIPLDGVTVKGWS